MGEWGQVLDALKETLDAWLARVKSPVLGYIVLALILVNWKPLWFLVFADQSVITRFAYFDAQTDFISLLVKPIVFGTTLALASPYINWAAAIVVSRGVTGHRIMQIEEQKKLAKSRRELAAALKETAIEETAAASAQIKATSEKENAADVIAKTKEKLPPKTVKNKYLQMLEGLSPQSVLLIQIIGGNDGPISYGGQFTSSRDQKGEVIKYFVDKFAYSNHRADVEIKEAFFKLTEENLVIDSTRGYSLTKTGFDLLDHLKANPTFPTNHNHPPHLL